MNLTKKEAEFIYDFFGRIDGHLFFHIFRDISEEKIKDFHGTFLDIYNKVYHALPKDDFVPDEEKSIEELQEKLDFYKRRYSDADSPESKFYWDMCIKQTMELIKGKRKE